jgi:methylamine dehydrogenase heavy chain
MLQRKLLVLGLLLSSGAANAQWDSIVGSVTSIGEPTERWVSVRGGNTAYLVDVEEGEVKGTLPLSRFSPAISPHVSAGKIYTYGSFYKRDVYGDLENIVITFDIASATPTGEIPLPVLPAGIGHSGMIGLIDESFLGIWNITPAMSVSLVDIRNNQFVSEIATPGCAAVYPLGRGFMMPCGDGTIQYITLGPNGEETGRSRSPAFFDVMEDPVYDYAVPSANGWMFVSLEGLVYEATLNGSDVVVSEAWTINPETNGTSDVNGVERVNDDNWRISGRQPFAFSPETNLLMTVMHDGGGQEVFEKPGTEVWAFSTLTKNRGYRIKMEDDQTVSSVQVTPGDDPLLLLMTSTGLQVHDINTGRKIRDINVEGGLIQNLF